MVSTIKKEKKNYKNKNNLKIKRNENKKWCRYKKEKKNIRKIKKN